MSNNRTTTDMLKTLNKEVEHHAYELNEILSKKPKTEVPVWVIAIATRAANDISDCVHYLDGELAKKILKTGGEASEVETLANLMQKALHHSEEMGKLIAKGVDVPLWVIQKMERSATDLSDITHFMDGRPGRMAVGGNIDKTTVDFIANIMAATDARKATGGGMENFTDYYLVVNLDERGEYSADVRNPKDETVYSINSAEHMNELIVDGFLKYKADEDLDRLTMYLMDLEIIPIYSQIYSEQEFDDKIRDQYATGGGLSSGIKAWYTKAYPTDELGAKLSDSATFQDIWNAVHKGLNVYSVLGVGDSLVRERVFEEVAKVYNVDYKAIYDLWISDDHRGGITREEAELIEKLSEAYEITDVKRRSERFGDLIITGKTTTEPAVAVKAWLPLAAIRLLVDYTSPQVHAPFLTYEESQVAREGDFTPFRKLSEQDALYAFTQLFANQEKMLTDSEVKSLLEVKEFLGEASKTTKSLAWLKEKLKPGVALKMVASQNPNNKFLGIVRYVIKAQTNSVALAKEKNASIKEGSWMEFPPASLIEVNEKGFTIYNPGKRLMTADEKRVYDNRPIDKEQSERDMMTDGSVMFYREKAYFANSAYPYLNGHGEQKGKRFDYSTKQIIDNKIKGELSLAYEFVDEDEKFTEIMTTSELNSNDDLSEIVPASERVDGKVIFIKSSFGRKKFRWEGGKNGKLVKTDSEPTKKINLDDIHELDLWVKMPDGRYYRRFVFTPEQNRNGVLRQITDFGVKEQMKENANGTFEFVLSVIDEGEAEKLTKLWMLLNPQEVLKVNDNLLPPTAEEAWSQKDFFQATGRPSFKVVKEGAKYVIYDLESMKKLDKVDYIYGKNPKQPPYTDLNYVKEVVSHLETDRARQLDFMWNHAQGGTLRMQAKPSKKIEKYSTRPGMAFDIAISRDLAIELLSKQPDLLKKADIMCLEMGQNGQWLEVKASDLVGNSLPLLYKTFELWRKNSNNMTIAELQQELKSFIQTK
jgi:hypothetical protein